MTDYWCDLCNEKPAAGVTADGVGACTPCMLDALEKIAAQAPSEFRPNRAMRRAHKRQQRLHNNRAARS